MEEETEREREIERPRGRNVRISKISCQTPFNVLAVCKNF
jgi:hypothetical protein